MPLLSSPPPGVALALVFVPNPISGVSCVAFPVATAVLRRDARCLLPPYTRSAMGSDEHLFSRLWVAPPDLCLQLILNLRLPSSPAIPLPFFPLTLGLSPVLWLFFVVGFCFLKSSFYCLFHRLMSEVFLFEASRLFHRGGTVAIPPSRVCRDC